MPKTHLPARASWLFGETLQADYGTEGCWFEPSGVYFGTKGLTANDRERRRVQQSINSSAGKRSMDVDVLKRLAHWVICDYADGISKTLPRGSDTIKLLLAGEGPGEDRMRNYYDGKKPVLKFSTEERQSLWEQLILLYHDVLEYSQNPGERLQDALKLRVKIAKQRYAEAFPQ